MANQHVAVYRYHKPEPDGRSRMMRPFEQSLPNWAVGGLFDGQGFAPQPLP